MTIAAQDAAKIIQRKCPNFKPHIALMLGSGMGLIAQKIENPMIISYNDLPHFYKTNVKGHGGKLYLGTLYGQPVACLDGRSHYYENTDNHTIKTIVRTLQLLGCKLWLATNASGSLRSDWKPGDLVMIKDHINFQFNNVLVGPNEDQFGPRFLDMQNMYSPDIRQQFLTIAKQLDIPLHEGIYLATLGPTFETPAEIHAYRILGAELVGMSTIAETTTAWHCGMKITVIAMITNMAAGMITQSISHEHTLTTVENNCGKVIKLIQHFLQQY